MSVRIRAGARRLATTVRIGSGARGLLLALVACALLRPAAARAQGQATAAGQGAAPGGAAPGAAAARATFSGPDSALEARTRAVASQLRCPVCQGLSLQDSPSELAQEMRGVVKEQLRAGRTPDEVKQYFINRYGEWILMEPQRHGFNWLVYSLPAVVLVGGLALIYVALRRWTAGAVPNESAVEHSPAASRDAPGGGR